MTKPTERTCSPECGRCEFHNAGGTTIERWWMKYPTLGLGDIWQDGETGKACWLKHCPSCGVRLLPGGETEARVPADDYRPIGEREGLLESLCPEEVPDSEGECETCGGHRIVLSVRGADVSCPDCADKTEPQEPEVAGEGRCKKCFGTRQIPFGEGPCPDCAGGSES